MQTAFSPQNAPQFATGKATSEEPLLKQRLIAEQNIRPIRSGLAEAARRQRLHESVPRGGFFAAGTESYNYSKGAEPMVSELELIVRSTEIDVNGHVNNAKYLEYLEWGREDWYESAGLDYAAFLAMGIQTVTVNVNINYRRECVLGDRLTVRTRPLRTGKTSYAFRQELIDAKGTVRADAEVTSVCMDASERRSREIPERLLEALKTEDGENQGTSI
jgi:thioesterase III